MRRDLRCAFWAVFGFLAAAVTTMGGGLDLVDRLVAISWVPDDSWMEWTLIGVFGFLAGPIGSAASLALVGCFDREG